jgi:hypothetical protein
MFRDRITMSELEPIRLPQVPAPPLNPCGFVLVAVPVISLQQWTVQQWLYQRAFAVAQTVMRPSIVERDLLGVWN